MKDGILVCVKHDMVEPCEVCRLVLAEQAARGVVSAKPAKSGDCDLCGEWSGQLEQGVCSPCRDERRLP